MGHPPYLRIGKRNESAAAGLLFLVGVTDAHEALGQLKANGPRVEYRGMDPQRLMRAGTPAEVSVLAVMALILGAGCLAWAAFPMAQDAPRGVMVGLGLVGVTVALTLVLAGAEVSPVYLHITVGLVTTLLSLMVAVAATERGLMMSALGYTWTAVYVAFFFRPFAARVYAALMITALGLSLLSARAPTDVSVWITISTMVWVAVAILSRLNARLRAGAHTDSLTGLLNRTGFAVAAARQRAMSERRGEPLALAVIDLDDFKAVNDRGGHAAGDRLLIELAGVWTALLRPGDLLARFGGDEFVLMLAGADEEQVEKLLARLARAHPASWTAGAVLCSDEESLGEAVDRADARLYVAKEPRRNAIDRDRHASTVRSWQPGRA
jgi:diguanylate cyclase (GGDEF)-like protein